MNKTGIGLLVAAALTALSASAFAQKPKASAPSAEAAPEQAAGGDDAAAGAEAGAGAAADEGDELPPEEESGLAAICKLDPAACPKVDFEREAQKDLREQIYAVQQVFALRARRFELNPYWSLTLNDQFVSHPAPGLAFNYYISNVMAVGINGNFYRPFNVDSEFNAIHRRAARVQVPLSEYDWSAALNFTYVPAYGKFAGFQDFIFHYDAYVVGGVGAISTRPIAVVDPDNRNFEYKPKVALNAGLGLRIFFNRWFAANLEVRDYIFIDEIEATTIAANPRDDSKWTDESSITNNVQAQLGFSIFIPFSFDYRLPK